MQNLLKVLPNKVDKSIILSLEKPHFSLIWLHGLGDSSAGFLDFFQQEQSPVFRGGRVKLIQAPSRPVTINGGMKFNSWYDIRSFSGQGEEQSRYSLEEINDSLGIVDRHVSD
jgi:phospholipase/carboxylesterase